MPATPFERAGETVGQQLKLAKGIAQAAGYQPGDHAIIGAVLQAVSAALHEANQQQRSMALQSAIRGS